METGEANIWRLLSCHIPRCRASFPVSNSDTHSVPAPPSHPAVSMARPAEARASFPELAATRGFVGPNALDPTAWLAFLWWMDFLAEQARFSFGCFDSPMAKLMRWLL